MSSISIENRNSKNCQNNQNIYELLDIESPREMFMKAKVAISIMTTMKRKRITTRTAANRAKITEKQLKAILSGGFQKITAFRLKRIEYRI